MDFAKSECGGIDVLVNNAGVMPLSPLSALKVDEWNWMIDVNIRGVMHGIAAVLPRMEAQGYGHIIDVSGRRLRRAADRRCLFGDLVRGSRHLGRVRKESDKICCACIYPGVVESELAETISDATARERMRTYRQIAIKPDAIGRAILYAIEQPNDVDVNEIVVRPLGTQV